MQYIAIWLTRERRHRANHLGPMEKLMLIKIRTCLPVILLAAAAFGVQGTAMAQGAASQVLVTGIGIDTNDANMAFISVNHAKSDNPACSTSTWAFVLPLTTTLQNHMFQELLAARTNQTQVTLVGSGLCDTYASVETLTFVNY